MNPSLEKETRWNLKKAPQLDTSIVTLLFHCVQTYADSRGKLPGNLWKNYFSFSFNIAANR